MKTLVSFICAVTLCSLTARGQETAGDKAKDAWNSTKETAKDVGHTLKRHTKKMAHRVREALTPDPEAHRVDVKVGPASLDIPKSIPPGKTAFVVTNTSDQKLTFEVEPNGGAQSFAMSLEPRQTKVLHVELERGNYHAGCLIKGQESHRKEVDLRVR
jgi:hypothetical protein